MSQINFCLPKGDELNEGTRLEKYTYYI